MNCCPVAVYGHDLHHGSTPHGCSVSNARRETELSSRLVLFRVGHADNLVEWHDESQAPARLVQVNSAADPLENRFNSVRRGDGEHDFFFRLDRNSENPFLFMDACSAAKENSASVGTNLHRGFENGVTPSFSNYGYDQRGFRHVRHSVRYYCACKFARPVQNLLSTKISSHHEAHEGHGVRKTIFYSIFSLRDLRDLRGLLSHSEPLRLCGRHSQIRLRLCPARFFAADQKA